MSSNGKQDEILQTIESMSVLDLSNLVKAIEERFGVSAAAPAVAMMAQAGAAPAQAAEDEKTEFDVVLTGIGTNKINVIKVVRSLTSLGLKEAKELVDNAPKPVKEAVSKEDAADVKAKLEEAGATVEIK